MPETKSVTATSSWASPPADGIAATDVGGKAAGLFRLPAGWTPPFFIVRAGAEFEEQLQRLLGLAAQRIKPLLRRGKRRQVLGAIGFG